MRGLTRRAGIVAAVVFALLVSASCVVTPGDPGPSDVVFDINSTLDRHPISPWIYGSNVARDMSANRLTLVRMGGNRIQIYERELNHSASRRLKLENALRHAVEREELFLLYQPVIDMATERLASTEALVRTRCDDIVDARHPSPLRS